MVHRRRRHVGYGELFEAAPRESFDGTTGALRLRWETRADGTVAQARLRVWLFSAISGRPL